MIADLGLILFGVVVGYALGWAFRPPCPRFEPKYWTKTEESHD